jgi:hypothetical protein
MDKNSIGHHATTSRTNSPNLGDDGDCLQRRENLAQVFFRRAGRFFSGISDAITGAFLSFAQSARNAWMHVEQAFSGRNSNTAVAHVKGRQMRGWDDWDDDDDEYISEANLVQPNSDIADTKNSLLAEKSSVTPDFFGLDEPSSAPDANKSSVLMDVPPERVSPKEDHEKNLPVNPSIPKVQEISNEERIFNEFSKRYESDKGYSSISPDDPAFDSSCLQFAKKFQEDHPENANIKYSEEVQEKRKAATALLFADGEIKAKAAEKVRFEEEKANKLAEQQRRQALPPGQADFEDFSVAYQAARETGREYKFVEGSKFLEPSCLSYATQRLMQQPGEDERSAIQALLSASGEPTAQVERHKDVVLEPASAAPPPPNPVARWKSVLQNLLGNSQEMPPAHQSIWMRHYRPDDKNNAWRGFWLLLSPQTSPPSSSVVSDIQHALSYQTGSAQNDEYQLSCFELAKRLLEEMVEFNVGSYLANRDIVDQTDDQKKIIAANLNNMKSVAEILRTDLQNRIDQLSHKKHSAVRKNIATSIPSGSDLRDLSDLSDKAVESASADFNEFVKDFQRSNQQTGVYEFTTERLKYRRPNCVAIAKSVIDTYQHLNTLVDSDKERLAAAMFLVNQYNLSSKH